MNNMDVWDKVKQPPEWALRQITAGRLKGKSDINPQWRYQVMTEQFGMCGYGWSYTIERLWTEKCDDGQAFAFAQINLWVKGADKPIPGIGGSMLIIKESSGLHASDEGYKMAVTDALSVAMKMLGIAADVYAGLWDGSKYKNQDDKPTKKDSPPAVKKEHWCNEHQTNFFKTEKMKSYAHPIEGTDKWCYEHKNEPKEEPERETKKSNNTFNMGTIRTALATKGYKTESEQLKAMMVSSWKEITDLEGAMKWAEEVAEKQQNDE